jgi:hypothetical protein
VPSASSVVNLLSPATIAKKTSAKIRAAQIQKRQT